MPESAQALHAAASDAVVGRSALEAPAGGRRRVLITTLAVIALMSLVLAATLSHGSARHLPLAGTRAAASHARGLSSLPPSAQGPVSAALGADSSSYAATAFSGGFRAASPAQRFAVGFGRSGLSLSSAGTHVGLSLRGIGYGSSLGELGEVAPTARANRVVYARQGFSEWYENGPLGLEQGFTIPRAPAKRDAGPLTLSMALSGNARASLDAGGRSITLSRDGHPALRYTGLTVTDARGRLLHSWLQLQPGQILLRVDTSGARYPLRIDPFIQQGEKHGVSGEIGEGTFADAVALSSEGTTALIGAPGDNGSVGAAWVFTQSGSTWTQQGAKLTGTGETGKSAFGWSVSLAGNGNTALIGGPADNGSVGAAWVFTRANGAWTQVGSKLTGTGTVGAARFGASVALSADASTALIGGTNDNSSVGAAWVFAHSTTWAQQGEKLTGSGETGAGRFGSGVALAENGNTALVGGPNDNSEVGAAWVFSRSGTTWTAQGSKLTGSGETGKALFGDSVALSHDGNTALMGGEDDNSEVGAAWVFSRSGTTWSALGSKLTGSGETGKAFFGVSVALSGDAKTALIGGPGDNSEVGAAWVFARGETSFTQQGSKLTGSGETGAGQVGSSVALSENGSTALIGGPHDNGEVGAAWAFTRSGTTWSQQGSKLTGTAPSGTEIGAGLFGASVALSGDGSTVLVGAWQENNFVGAAWAFTRVGSVWTGSKLTGAGETGSGRFGINVALSRDGNTALIGGEGDSSFLGAAWVFTRSGSTWTQQGEKLTGSGESGEGEFGDSVALSEDGNTALIGANGDNKEVGAAFAFTRSGSTWTQQGSKLTGSGETGAGEFGSRVALSADGNTALVGGESDNSKAGAAWVFTRAGSTWTQQGSKLTGSGETGAGHFGASVALSGESNTALIGGPFDNTEVGAAWVFTRSGSTWTAQGSKLTGSGETGAGHFGSAVALAENGSTALIGGENDNSDVGAAWVFTRSGSTWTQEGSKLTGGAESGAGFFGASVALTPDASTALIGAPNDTSEVGAAWVFVAGPTVETKPASAITQTTATLNATVNPNGSEVTKCEFEYGTTTSYGSTAPCGSSPGAGESLVAVTANIAGLTANTTYHFRISATSSRGTSKGADHTLKTPVKAPTVETKAASGVTSVAATLNATVNPNAGEVSECKFEYGTTTSYGSSAPCTPSPGSGESAVAVSAAIGSLSAGTTYHFRISATNSSGTSKGTDETFKTLLIAPTVEIKPASAITQTTATLNGTVNPNGSEVNKCEFEYGTTTSYGSSAPCTPAPGSGGSPVTVSAAVNGLTANTTYHFRISAANGGGTTKGTDETFKTTPNSPAVESKPASSVTKTSMTLNGTVNPNGGLVTECKFEYGTTISYGSSAPCTPSPGSGTTPVMVSAAISGLSPNTTYHFRIVAMNGSGTSKSSDESAKTLPLAPEITIGEATSITPTSATLNATVYPNGGQVTACTFEYGETTEYEMSMPCSPPPGGGTSGVPVSASVTGLNANSTYFFRVTATNAGGTASSYIQSFNTLPNAPFVVTGTATAITKTSATLNAEVDPRAGEVSECKFEYGTTTSYGSTVPCTPSPGAGEEFVPVSGAISGLTANTTYHYRVVATSPGGTTKGSDETLKTLPSITITTASLPADEIGVAYSQTLASEGGTAPYHWSISSGSLPGGLSLSEGGAITGTPSAAGVYSFTVKVTDSSTPTPQSATANLTIDVTQPTFTASLSSYQWESSEVHLSEPIGVASAPGAEVWLADSATDHVVQLNSEHHALHQIGSAGSGEGQFKGIAGIATNAAGDLYVLDSGNARVQEFSPTGTFIRAFGSFGTAPGDLEAPLALAIDSEGHVWVLNNAAGTRVQEFTAEGVYMSGFGSFESPLVSPTGIAVSGGHLYVTEDGLERVVELSTTGSVLGSFGSHGTGQGQFYRPSAIASDPATGNLYVAELGGLVSHYTHNGLGGSLTLEQSVQRIQEFKPTGTFITAFGSTGSGAGQFSGVRGLALNSAGTVYVADTGNKRLQEWVQAP